MSELIGRLVAQIGVHWAAAEKAVKISRNFLAEAGPSDKERPRRASLPEAEALMGRAVSKSSGGIGFDVSGAVVVGTTVG
jgi:predicted NAD-dependent protein-ADP-ribosyltransferase YbiA (DUF1768 family)